MMCYYLNVQFQGQKLKSVRWFCSGYKWSAARRYEPAQKFNDDTPLNEFYLD